MGCSELQCVAVSCSELQWVAVKKLKKDNEEQAAKAYGVLQCVAVRCSMLQCVAVCCSV